MFPATFNNVENNCFRARYVDTIVCRRVHLHFLVGVHWVCVYLALGPRFQHARQGLQSTSGQDGIRIIGEAMQACITVMQHRFILKSLWRMFVSVLSVGYQ